MVPSILIAAPARRRHTPGPVRSVLAAACLLGALTAQAQQTGKTARPDPLDPQASVPALRYETSLALYRRWGDAQPVSWRDANDTVTRIGGWRAYIREAQQPDPAPAAKPAQGGHKSP